MWAMALTVGKWLLRAADEAVRALAWVWLVSLLAGLVVIQIVAVERNQAVKDLREYKAQVNQERTDAALAAQQAQLDSAQLAQQSAAELVQKNREMAQKNQDLKKEIAHAYANFGHAQPSGTRLDPYGNAVGRGDADACFGAEFGLLWNRANADPNGQADATGCPAGAPCAGASAH